MSNYTVKEGYVPNFSNFERPYAEIDVIQVARLDAAGPFASK